MMVDPRLNEIEQTMSKTSITGAAAAEEIGCHQETIRRACKRLGIRRPLTPAKVERLKQAISLGRGSAGGWQAGRRRHTALTPSQTRALMQRVDKVRAKKEISREQISRELEISSRTYRRWLAGEDVPAAESIVRLQRWLDAHGG